MPHFDKSVLSQNGLGMGCPHTPLTVDNDYPFPELFDFTDSFYHLVMGNIYCSVYVAALVFLGTSNIENDRRLIA